MRRRLLLYTTLLIVLLAVVIVINLYIVSTRLITKERVETMLNDLMGIPISVEKVKFRILKGIEISNLTVGSTDKENLLKARKIIITYDKTKLLQGELSFSNIEIINPELNINEQTINQLRIKSKGQTKKLPTISIRNGKIYFSNSFYLQKDYRHLLDNVNLNFYPFAQTRYVVEGTTNAGFLGKWLISGEINPQESSLNLTFFTHNLELTETIPEKLSSYLKRGWVKYQPRGRVNMGVSFTYLPDKKSKPAFNILLESLDTTIVYQKFPYKLYNVKGKLDISESGIIIQKISGSNGKTRVTLEGTATDISPDAGYEIKITAKDLNLDKQLAESLPQKLKPTWEKLKPTGLVDIVTIAKRIKNKKKIYYNVQINCHDCSSTPVDFPYPMTKINGQVNYNDGEITLNSLSAYRNNTKITFKGILWGRDIKQNPLDITIRGENVDTSDYALKDAMSRLTEGSEKLWEIYQPEGVADVTVNLKNIIKDLVLDEIKVSVDCKNNTFKYGPNQYTFSNLKGRLQFLKNQKFPKGKITLYNLTSQNDRTMFEISGNLIDPTSLVSPTAEAPYSLEIKATNLNLNSSLRGILPEGIIEFSRILSFSGNLDLSTQIQKKYIKYWPHEPPQNKIEYRVEAKLSQASLSPGIELTDVNGKVTLTGHEIKGKHHSDGSMNLSHVKIAGKRLENLTLVFSQENNRVSIYSIKGSAYRGSADGFFNISTPKNEYTGHMNFSGIDLKDFTRDTFLSGKDISGKLSLELELSGKDKDSSSLKGNGKLIISEGQLWDVPILLSIINSLKVAKRSKFEQGEVKFEIADKKIIIHRAKFISPSITLKGKGTIDFNGNLDLQLDTKASKKDIIPVEIIKIFIDIVSDQIYTIKLKGTFTDPKASIQALPHLKF